MADDPEDQDEAQADKNATLRTRAQASELASQQRTSKPGAQALLARARRGRDMTDDADEDSKKVGGIAKKMAKLYDNPRSKPSAE